MQKAARMPCSTVSNCSNAGSVDGVALPIHLFDDMRMFRGLLFLIPRGSLGEVLGIVREFVIDS